MIQFENRDSVTVVSIDHGKANALDVQLLDGLREAVSELGGRTGAIVLTGNGKLFSAGLDLRRLVAGGETYTRELVTALDRLLRALVGSPLPLVAAIDGHAIAGGYIVASACDLRIMARGAGRVGLTEMALGVPFPPRALELVRVVVGDRRIRRVVLRAELHADEDALELGLVDELTEPQAVVERAVEIAAQLARIPPQTFALTRQQLLAPVEANLRVLDDDFTSAVAQQWLEPSALASMRRFVEERLG